MPLQELTAKEWSKEVADTLERLLRGNHATLDIRYENYYTNHVVHNLYALAELGGTYCSMLNKPYGSGCSAFQYLVFDPIEKADPDCLKRCYQHRRERLWRLHPPQVTITAENRAAYAGQPRHYSAFLVYYDAQVALLGFEHALEQHLPAVFSGLLGAVGHPSIHLSYAYKYRHPGVLAEALAFANSAELSIIPLADAWYAPAATASKARYNGPDGFRATLADIAADTSLDPFDWRNEQILELIPVLLHRKWHSVLQRHFHAVQIDTDNLGESLTALQQLAVDVYIGSRCNGLLDFFIAHLITIHRALVILQPVLCRRALLLRMTRAYWLFFIVVYICQGRPVLTPSDPSTWTACLREHTSLASWSAIIHAAIQHEDEHVPKLVSAMLACERENGPCQGRWRAAAALTVALVGAENYWSLTGRGCPNSELGE